MRRAKYKGADLYMIELGGTEEGYAAGGQEEILHGRFFTDTENRHRRPVAVIGEDVHQALFSNVESVGKWIDVDGHQFEIVGVLARPSSSMLGSQDLRGATPLFHHAKDVPCRG